MNEHKAIKNEKEKVIYIVDNGYKLSWLFRSGFTLKVYNNSKILRFKDSNVYFEKHTITIRTQ